MIDFADLHYFGGITWSLSVTFYSPIGTPVGATFTVGSKEGVSFFTLSEFGLGVGMGANFDLNGGVPNTLNKTEMDVGSYRISGGFSSAFNFSIPMFSYKLDYAATGYFDTDPCDNNRIEDIDYYYGPTSDENLIFGPSIGAKFSVGGGLYLGGAYRWW